MGYTLEADSIQLSYENRRILGDVYLKCEVGRIVGLLGRNGSGKSSLLKVIFGAQTADCKSVRLNGKYCASPYKVHGLIFMVPQRQFLPNHFRVDWLFQLHGVLWDEFVHHFPDCSPIINQKLHESSTGKKRLIEVYLGVMSASRFTFMDEPFAALDPRSIEKIKELIRGQLPRKGFLISDQRWEEVWEMSDDLYFLKNGKAYPRTEVLRLDDWKAYLAI
jgi:ABC-type multidrug transport system ATPase subunit